MRTEYRSKVTRGKREEYVPSKSNLARSWLYHDYRVCRSIMREHDFRMVAYVMFTENVHGYPYIARRAFTCLRHREGFNVKGAKACQ